MKQFKGPDLDYGALCSDIDRSRIALRWPREVRNMVARQLAGKWYSEEGSKEAMPLNGLAQYATIVGQKLIAKNPRAMLTTNLRSMKPTVAAMQQWSNDEIEHMNLEGTLGRAAFDALITVGVIKVALAEPDDSAKQAWGLESGCAFAEVVSFDDLVFDTNARSFDQVRFIGHRIRVSLDVAKENPHYNRDLRSKLTATPPKLYNEFGDEKTDVIGATDYKIRSDEFDPQVELWEIYLPRHRVIVTLQADDVGGARTSDDVNVQPIGVQPWIGPHCGPYHILGFGIMPDAALPTAPVQNLIDLNDVRNKLYRKQIRQAERQKDVTLVRRDQSDTGETIRKMSDGDMEGVNDPEAVKVVSFGGPNQANFQFGLDLTRQFKEMAGNLDALGGLAPQSGTAKQDSMLNENASSVMSDMQAKMVDFVSAVVNGLCWFWYHDPFKVMRTNYSPPGLPDISIDRAVTPQQRQWANWRDLRVQVDPYSMQHQTPQQRAGKLTEIVTNVITPMMGLLQQQGVVFDVQVYLKKLSEYLDMPDLPEILTLAEPPQQDPSQGGGGQPEQPGSPASTTRNYVRESRSAGTAGAEENKMVTAMAAAQPTE